MFSKIATILFALPAVIAQAPTPTQTLWGQCHGPNYMGPIVCGPTATCTTYNPYYGQCIPATSIPTSTTSTTSKSTITPTPITSFTSSCKLTSYCSTKGTTGGVGQCVRSGQITTACATYCSGSSRPPLTWTSNTNAALEKRCTSSPPGSRSSTTTLTPTTTTTTTITSTLTTTTPTTTTTQSLTCNSSMSMTTCTSTSLRCPNTWTTICSTWCRGATTSTFTYPKRLHKRCTSTYVPPRSSTIAFTTFA